MILLSGKMLHSLVASLNSNRNDNRLNVNGNNWNDNNNGYAFGMALAAKAQNMITCTNLYEKIISFENLILAWKKARKGKTTKGYVIEFEQNLFYNLMALHYELKSGTYTPKPLEEFVIRDPKTRRIHKSDFKDRIVHHAIVNILEPIYEKIFIYDSCANRVSKGNLFALKRFSDFMRKVSENGKVKSLINANQIKGYCLKADIKHYFQEVDHTILMQILERKITDKQALNLIEKINTNFRSQRERERESNVCKRHASRQFNFTIFC